ncbi:FCD domain protein [compost metagenome]
MVNDRVQRYRMLILKNKLAKSKTMAAEHRRILACIEKQDGDGAEHAMREHILSFKDETARGVEQRLEESGNVAE